MIHISRSAIEERRRCPRSHYYRYRYKQTGVEEAIPSIHLRIGLSVHTGLEALFKSEGDINAAVEATKEEWSSLAPQKGSFEFLEGAALCEALVRGWHRGRWKAFHERYEVVSIEEEVQTVLAPGVVLIARADMVVRDRLDATLWVWNWKTTGSTKDFSEKWRYDVQMWTEALAMEDHLGEEVRGCLVEGLYKGTKRDGGWSSDLIYFYGKGSPITEVHLGRPRNWKGWKKYPVWTTAFPGGEGVKAWVDWLPQSTLEKYFIRAEPVIKNDSVVEDWLKQVTRMGTDDAMVLNSTSEEDREIYFSQRFSHINCAWCAFKDVCMQRTSIEQLMEEGFLKKRVDHHDPRVLR